MTSDELTLLLRQCRKLFIRRHEVWANIGIHEFEKGAPQRLWIDVQLYVPLRKSASYSDRIEDVVDYDFVRETIAARLKQGHIGLQETLCDDVAHQLLSHGDVRAVCVSTCKPDVYPDCEAVGVEVFLIKD
jgi:7,8-dihydroneopterin aldolase/epimerase/oxygenase